MSITSTLSLKRLATIILILISGTVFAQDGKFNVRFNMESYDCESRSLFVDIEVQANAPSHSFQISDQNYRFSFTRSSVAPFSSMITSGGEPLDENPLQGIHLEQELDLSGFVIQDNTISFYDPHNLVGSMDTIVSYNVNMTGGNGFPLISGQWTRVGRIRVDVLQHSSCVELIWHTHDPLDFPPTFIGEKFNGLLTEASEGTYGNLSVCLADLCSVPLPVELARFTATPEECQVQLEWETATEENNNYFILDRSLDGENFSELVRIDGNGTSQDPHSYFFKDETVASEQYYRLSQVDFDGEIKIISDVITVKSTCFDNNLEGGVTAIYPNPVLSGKVNFEYHSELAFQTGILTVTDMLGREVLTEEVPVQSGPNLIQFDSSNLSSGTYSVIIVGEDWFSAGQKLVKINP